jgi:phosphotransferase system HPr (HPr) family protein
MRIHKKLRVICGDGLHARPCGELMQYIDLHSLNAFLIYKNEEIKLDSVLELVSLCIGYGESCVIGINSPHADTQMRAFINTFSHLLIDDTHT